VREQTAGRRVRDQAGREEATVGQSGEAGRELQAEEVEEREDDV
jgi:hypothetical protein